MIKAIFFDWGNVFAGISGEREERANKILKPFGLSWRTFYPHWRKFYILRSAGNVSSDKEFEFLIQRTLNKKIPVRKIIDISIEEHTIPKEYIDVVRKLKKDYLVGILSNNVQRWVVEVLKNYSIERLFDAVIISSRVGARKPNAKIYLEALKKLRVKPEETVFVSDEVAEDLVAASGLSIKTIWFNANYKGWWREDDRDVLKIYKPDATIKNLREVTDIVKRL